MKFTFPPIAVCLILSLAVFPIGCDDAASKLKEKGAKVVEATTAKVQDVEWGLFLSEFESAGLNIKELAGLYSNKRWDEAKVWISKIDSEPAKVVFLTIGEVLLLEELEGVEPCKTKVDELLKAENLSKERKKTLEIMRSYVGSKGDMRTSDIAVLIGLTYLTINGFSGGIETPHGDKIHFDKLLFLSAVSYARETLHQKVRGSSSVPEAGK